MKQKIQQNKYYKLKVNLFGRIETYVGKVLTIENGDFRFETEDDNTCRALRLRLKDIIYAKEIECQKKNKVHKISTKKQFTNLKPSLHPEF